VIVTSCFETTRHFCNLKLRS